MADLTDLAVQSNAIAQQNNPEFAAFNASIQARPTPFNGFADFVANTNSFNRQLAANKEALDKQLADKQKDRDFNLKLKMMDQANLDKQRRKNLLEEYFSNGGMELDAVNWDEARLLSNIYNLKRQNRQQFQGFSLPTGENNIGLSSPYQTFSVSSILNQSPHNTSSEILGDRITRFAEVMPHLRPLSDKIQNPDIAHNLSDEDTRKTLQKAGTFTLADVGTEDIPDDLGFWGSVGQFFTNDKNNFNEQMTDKFGLQGLNNTVSYHRNVVRARDAYKKENGGTIPRMFTHNKARELRKYILKQYPELRKDYDITNIFYDPLTEEPLLLNRRTGKFDQVRVNF